MMRAAAFGQLKRTPEAKAELAKLRELRPDFTMDTAGAICVRYNFSDELREPVIDGLRKAGLGTPDEPAAAD